MLHLARDETRALVDGVTSPEDWIEHERRAAVWVRDRLVPYPFQLHLAYAPEDVREECLAALPAQTARLEGAPADVGFADWIAASLGAGIGRHFMVPYNEKLATVPATELTCEWLGRFVPRPAPADIRAGAESMRTLETGYNRRFRYPRQGGADLLWRALASRIGTIETNARVRGIDSVRRSITLETGEQISYGERLLSSVPLDEMCRLVSPLGSALAAGRRLRASVVTCVNLGLRRLAPAFRDVHWVYLPERHLRAYRVGFYTRLSEAMSPPAREGVYVEIAHAPGAGEPELVRAAISDLRTLGAIGGEGDVEVAWPVRIPAAYVIHDRHCAPARAAILQELSARGINMIGRYGRWEYSSIDDALWQGMRAAGDLVPTP